MARSLRLSILTPVGPLVSSKEVAWIQARLADGGSIGIWPGHAPLLGETAPGPVRYSDGAREHSLDLQAGILHIDLKRATVLVQGAAGVAPAGQQAPLQEPTAETAKQMATEGT